MSTDFAPRPPRPKGWEDLFATTSGLCGVAINEIEAGRVDWEYRFDSKDMRPCGRQGCEQKHAHGWLVALPGRRFVHVGNDCALKYAQDGLWSSKLDGYRERVNADARAAALVQVRDEAQRKQHWLDNDETIAPAIVRFESFARQAKGPLMNELAQRAERGQTLIEKDVKLSEDQVQTRRAMLAGGRTTDQPGAYVASVERQTIGEISGLECMKLHASPRELQARLQRLVTTLLTWEPHDDRDAQRALVRATRDLAPLSNQLNSCLKAEQKFFTASNLANVMLLDVVRNQGITAIELVGQEVAIHRRSHWQSAA